MKKVVDYTKEIEWDPRDCGPTRADSLKVLATNTNSPPHPDYHTAISIWNGKDVMFADMYGNVMWANGRKAVSTIRNVKSVEEWVRVKASASGEFSEEAGTYPTLSGARYARPFDPLLVGYFETYTRRFVRVGEEDTMK